MGVELAGLATIQPLVGSVLVADVAVEAASVRIGEGEEEGAAVRLVADRHGFGCTEVVEVVTAAMAVEVPAGALATAGVADEDAGGIGRSGEEGQGAAGVGGVVHVVGEACAD